VNTTAEKLSEEVRARRIRIVRRVLRWARTNRRAYPWREEGRSPYEILVAEVLLKRTTSTAATRIYDRFLESFPSPSAIAEAPAPYLGEALRPVGLHNQRARGIKQMAQYIERYHGGKLPQDVHLLEQIPHAGPYIARAVASFGFGKTAAVVDSNVARIYRRLFSNSLALRAPATLMQQIADAIIPQRRHREFNYALLDLGATVCRYDRPRCSRCPLQPVCDYAQQHGCERHRGT